MREQTDYKEETPTTMYAQDSNRVHMVINWIKANEPNTQCLKQDSIDTTFWVVTGSNRRVIALACEWLPF